MMVVVKRVIGPDGTQVEETQQILETRVTVGFEVGAKGEIKPDIKSEAPDVATAMSNFRAAADLMKAYIAESWTRPGGAA